MSDDNVTTFDRAAEIRARLASMNESPRTTEDVIPPEKKHPTEFLYSITTVLPDGNLDLIQIWEGYLLVTGSYIAIAKGEFGEIQFFCPIDRLYSVALAEDPDEVD